LITRAGPEIPGVIRVKGLSPSQSLFTQYLREWRDKDPELWWSQYTDLFNKELHTDEKLMTLRRLWRLVRSGKVIALACYCTDSRYCHRTLVGDFLRQKGVRVEEKSVKQQESQVEFEQLSMF